jgi:hypothetical protein
LRIGASLAELVGFFWVGESYPCYELVSAEGRGEFLQTRVDTVVRLIKLLAEEKGMRRFAISDETVRRYIDEIAAGDLREFACGRIRLARRRFLSALGLWIPALPCLGAELLARLVRAHARTPGPLGRRVLRVGRWLAAAWSDEVYYGQGELPSAGELEADDTTFIDVLFSEADWRRLLALAAKRPRLVVQNAWLRRLLSRRLTRPKTVIIGKEEVSLSSEVRAAVSAELGKLSWDKVPAFVLHDLGVVAGEDRVFKQLYDEAVTDSGRAWDLTAGGAMRYYRLPPTAAGVRKYIELCGTQLGPEDGRLETLPLLGASMAARVGFLWDTFRQDLGKMPKVIADGLRSWGPELSDGRLNKLVNSCTTGASRGRTPW